MEKQINKPGSLKLFTIAITLAGILFYTGTLSNIFAQDSTSAIDPKVRQAQALLEKGLALQAIEAFKKIVRLEPNNLLAQLGLGAAEEKQGHLDRAIAPYEAALKINPKQITALTRLGFLYSIKKENWPLAIERLSEVIQLNPTDSISHRLLADIYSWDGRFAEAEKNYLILISKGVEDTSLQLSLAQVMTWQERGKEALPLFTQAKLKVKLDETSRYAEALAKFQSKQYDDAEKAYLALINEFPTKVKKYRDDLEKLKVAIADLAKQELNSTLEEARNNFREGKYNEAFTGFEKVLAVDDSLEIRLEYVDLLSSEPESREKALNELALLEPTKEIEIKRANLLTLIAEKREDAFNLLVKLTSQYPKDLEIEQQLTNLLSWVEYNDIKAMYASEILQRKPEAIGLRPPLIRYYMKTKLFSKAILLLEAEVRENDTSVANRLYLAEIAVALGKPFNERTNLEAVLRLEPNNAQANERLGWIILEQDKNPEKALKKFKIASHADPTAYSPRLGQANALLALNRPLEAEDRLHEIGISTDPAVDDALLRVQKSLVSLNIDKSLKFTVTTSTRSGSEANNLTSRNKRASALSTSFAQVEASTRISSNVGIDVKARAVRLEANRLGNLRGTEGEIVLKLLPKDSLQLSLGAGATLTGKPTFLTRIDIQSGIRKSFYIQGTHSPITESFLSYAGIPDKQTGTTVGRVMATGVSSGLILPVGKDMDFNFSTKIERLTAKALPSNLRREFQVNLSRELKNEISSLKKFDYVRPSINVLYFDFDKDLNTVLLSPKSISEPLLVRGYFSPKSFFAPGARLDFALHALNERLNIVGGFGLAAQITRGNTSQFFSPGTQFGFNTSIASRYNVTDRLIGTLDYSFSNTGSVFRESRIKAGFSINLEKIIEKPITSTKQTEIIEKLPIANNQTNASAKQNKLTEQITEQITPPDIKISQLVKKNQPSEQVPIVNSQNNPTTRNKLTKETTDTYTKTTQRTKENTAIEKVQQPPVINNQNSTLAKQKTLAEGDKNPVLEVIATAKETNPPTIIEEASVNTNLNNEIASKPIQNKATYTVQVGASKNEEEAKRLSLELREEGFPTTIIQVNLASKGTLYRVHVGKYQTAREANAIAQELTTSGYDGIVTVY